ncbi:B3 domain-containing transcription factor VRN1-like [Quercus robur]|uniref:B3 domain-containing transcription factor VRN1-like n=1 Tax=Quercus robur TaxID=38942 RepID=UPI002163FE8C|nr:B3 domain-containing transcription factor VRN1-like [Quercus robur]
MHKLFCDALCIHVSVDGYFWSGFNSAELSTVATLIAPYGDIWQVGLKKADNNIWFRNGWQDFAEYHSICYGYFLVFRYERNSSFHVLIFDKTATEIQYPPRKNCKLEDHQVEIIDLDEDDTNISSSMYRPTEHEVREKFVLKKLLIMSRGSERAIQAAEKFKPKNPSFMAMRFGKGWVAFSKDNNLEEGDVCVFEVIERKPVVLSVLIFHMGDHQSLD